MPRQFRLSVRLSVTRMICVITAKHIIRILSPSDRPIILVFRHRGSLRKSGCFTPNGGAKYKGSNFRPICSYISETVIQGESKKVDPLRVSSIFSLGLSLFCIKFCTFIGNIYPRMCTDYFRSFILAFSEMALILLRAPIIFMVSSFDCSAISVLCRVPAYGK